MLSVVFLISLNYNNCNTRVMRSLFEKAEIKPINNKRISMEEHPSDKRYSDMIIFGCVFLLSERVSGTAHF